MCEKLVATYQQDCENCFIVASKDRFAISQAAAGGTSPKGFQHPKGL
jgi:hypothetical protein